MKVINKKDFEKNLSKFIKKIKEGAIFICPTDTIYGLSCDAENSDSVKKVREIKQRPDAPFSIWAPSKEWIESNCEVEDEIDNLPGPYTLILPLITDSIADEVNPNLKTIGVRIPDHWFSKVVEELGIPLITTSVNLAGEPHMTSMETLDGNIKEKVDFIIYEGEKESRASTIIKKGKKEIRD